MQERFCKLVGKVLLQSKVGEVSKFQEMFWNDNFKAGNGEERKEKGKVSVLPEFFS